MTTAHPTSTPCRARLRRLYKRLSCLWHGLLAVASRPSKQSRPYRKKREHRRRSTRDYPSTFPRIRYQAIRRKRLHGWRLPIGIAYRSTTKEDDRTCNFDFDSFTIRVDNCASRSISNDIKDFVSPLTPEKGTIKGLTGSTSGLMKGTIRWNIQDDNGINREVLLPKAKLLSPQHWAQC